MIQIYGHRGFRGRWPENTLTGFLEAIKAGATGVELDVVLSKDRQVVVSHEPWMSHKICLVPNKKTITESGEKDHNLYNLTYGQIKQYDCGSKNNPCFPEQVSVSASKPLLREVLQAVEGKNRLVANQILVIIEVKYSESEKHVFYAPPEEYARVLVNEIREANLPVSHIMVQSFSEEILQEMKKQAPEITLGLLTEEKSDPEKLIQQLGFLPQYFNPKHVLVTEQLLSFCRSQRIKILPWTVNTAPEMRRLIRMGVCGLITDYPDIGAKVAASVNKEK